jgi:hypothetical protein
MQPKKPTRAWNFSTRKPSKNQEVGSKKVLWVAASAATFKGQKESGFSP